MQSHLWRHVKTEHSLEEFPFKCHYCDQKFKTVNLRKSHEHSNHSDLLKADGK